MSRKRSWVAGGAFLVALSTLAAAPPGAAQESPPKAGDPVLPGLRAALDRYLVASAEEKKAAEGESGKPEELVITRKKRLQPEVDVRVPLEAGGSRDTLGPEVTRDIVPWSVEAAVDLLPGFSSRTYSGDEYLRPSIVGRGMPDNGFTEFIAVHVDGLNYSRLIYGWTALSQFPFVPENMYAAEGFRGGHAIRYGPTALGGVINFITPPIPEKYVIGQKTTLGGHGFHSTRVFSGGTDPQSGVGFLVSHTDRSGETFRDQSQFRVNDTDAKVAVPMGVDGLLTFHTYYWRDVHQLMGRLTRAQLDDDPGQNSNAPEVRWSGWNYGYEVGYRRETSKDTWFEAQYYDRFGHQNLPSMQPAAPPFTAFRNQVIDTINRGITLRGETPADLGVRHVLHGGLRYHREGITRDIYQDALATGARTRVSDVETDTEALSLHLDDTVKLGNLTLNGGARYENILDSEAHDGVSGNDRDFSFDDTLYGLSANYAFTPQVAAFTNYHQSFRAPQVFTYNFTNLRQKMTFEHGQTGELGLRVDDWKGVSGNLVAWRTRYSDFIEFDPLTGTSQNLGAFSMRGYDLTVGLRGKDLHDRLDGWSAYSTHTWQDSEFRSGANDGKHVAHVPGRSWNGNFRYDHAPTGLYGLLGYRQRGTTYATPDNLFTSPGYTLFNGRVGWRREMKLTEKRNWEVEVALSVNNLTDRNYHLRHNATQYVPGTPRSLFLEFGVTIDL